MTSDDRERREEQDKGRDRKKASPQRSDEQDSPAPERPETPRERHGQAIRDLEDPPQAEGPRKDSE
jgi:hypothetical protein